METIYTATVENEGGRDGTLRSTDGIMNLDIKRPVEMDGEGGTPNPEMLFAAAYSACYNSALKAVASRHEIILPDHTVMVSISFNKDGHNNFLSGKILVDAPGMDQAELQQLANTAHAVCPYSKAVKGNIDITVEVSG